MIRRFSQWLMFAAALILLAAVVFYNMFEMKAQASKPMPMMTKPASHPDVKVVSVQSDRYAARVTAFGAADPHFELALTAQISGRVVALSDRFEPGRRVGKGTVLSQLEESDYRAAVTQAEKELADARLDLLEEERQVQQAKSEWAASGLKGEPDSELVLRKPQLAAARAAVANAQATLAAARKDLAQTRITAPFDALVVERKVAPGSYLTAGGEVATLYSTDRVEIALPFSTENFNNLPDLSVLGSGDWPAQIINTENGQSWGGRVLRAEQHLEGTTRQRTLIVAVDNPLDQQPALLPGTFLRVTVKGREVDRLWELPGTALSQRGEIWYVTAEGTLACFSAEPLFTDGDKIYVAPPDDLAAEPQMVLTHPLSSYLTAMAVNPVEERSHE